MKNSAYWSKLTNSLSPYIPGEQPKSTEKIIKLNTNENPYPPSPKVIEAIKNAADEKLKLYPDPACTVFREAVASRYNLKPEQVFCGNGSDEILAFAFAAFFENASGGLPHPQSILFPAITYSFYPVYASLWNVPYKSLPLAKDFSVNSEDYLQDSGGVIIPNPNAPTGRALKRKELTDIASRLEKTKKVFILDEAYIAFNDDPDSGSMIPFINEHPNLLIVRTLSKEASLAGLRSGFAVGSTGLIEGLCRIRDSFNSYTMDRLALAASAAAVLDTAYYDETSRRIISTRNRFSKALTELGFSVIPSQANFIFIMPPPSSLSAAKWLVTLREKGILIRHFNKPDIENYLRVSIGTDGEMNIFLNACKGIIGRKA